MYSKSLFIVFLFVSNVLLNAQTIKSISDVEIKKIDSIFNSYENIPGCAIAVVKKGETLFQKGYGMANLEYDIPVTTKTVFDANAIAKQVTAACVFKLVEDGMLKLDDPMEKFFPEFPEYKEGQITVKNLVYQTSGLRSYLAILFSQNQYFGDRVDNEDVLQMVMKQRNLNFQPGSRQDLSNSNYVLLANIVKEISNKNLADYAKEKIFDPLNMTNTFFADSQNKVIRNRAMAYQEEAGQVVLDHFFNPTAVGDGGLQTTIEDMVKWTNSLSSGDVLGKDLVTKIITSGTLNSGAETNYAGGLFVQNHYDISGLPTVRHSGMWAGFRSLFYKFLNQDTAFIIMSNNANTNVWELLDQLTPLFLADEIANAQNLVRSSATAPEAVNNIIISSEEKRRFVGSFYNRINGNLRSIALVDDKLFYKRQPNDPGSALLVISPNELAFEAAPFIRLSFGVSYEGMSLIINDEEPTFFDRYQSFVYDKNGLKEFENYFYNEDLDVVYQVKSIENQLQILIEGKELVVLAAFSKDMFRDEHFGYITFQRDSKGKIKGFSRTDNTFTNLVFDVLKSVV